MYKSVLVVDDVELSRGILKNAVLSADEDAKVVAVENAYAAINKLRSKKFDLVIMDIMMPKGDGFELLNMVSQLSIQTKIIVISSLDRTVIDMMGKIGQLYEIDIISALEKPIESKKLTELVAGVFSLSSGAQEQQLSSLESINIFEFPIGVYYQPQTDTSADRSVIGIDVCGNWSSIGHYSLLLSNHLLPDVATVSDKKLYNQILIGRFLQEYREYFKHLPDDLSFTLHIHPDCFDDSFIYGCFIELQEMNSRHDLNLYITNIDALESANQAFFERLSKLVELGVGIVVGTQELTADVITRAKRLSVKQVNIYSEALSPLCLENNNQLLDPVVTSSENEKVKILCCEVENKHLSAFLTASGLVRQQGVLFSAPVSAENLRSELSKQRRGQPTGEV